MNLGQFSEITHGEIKVLSGYNGKVLCKRFDIKKHEELSAREVLDVWSDLKIAPALREGHVYSIICVYVDGTREWEKEKSKCD